MENEFCYPSAFFDYIMLRLNLMTHNLHYELLRRCERILISVINDTKFQRFLPSVMAAAIMCIVSKDIEPDNALDYRNQLVHLLNICEDSPDPLANSLLQPQFPGTLVLELDWLPVRTDKNDPLVLCITGADSSFRLVEVSIL